MGHVIKSWGKHGGTIAPSAAPPPAPELPPPPADLEAARSAARGEAFAAGHAEAVARAAGLLAEAEAQADRALEGLADTTLALARKMAERIVGRAVALDPGVVAEIVAEALSSCRPGDPIVRIRVHPDDLAAVEARREWLAARAGGAPIELVPDETVGRYGCLIDTARGRIDGRLAVQLTAMEQAVRGDRQQESGDG